ncbi:MAG: NlpC/P60 family protein [Bilifractor sp.]
MGKTEKAIQWMEQTARDNSHGYDQRYRWGEKGDYDCSSAVITAWQVAGVPVKTNGATYTGNMKPVFLRCGFKDITTTVNLATGAGLQRGDVLLNTTHHTAMYCGNGKLVNASINERGGAVGGVPGDQTGREFVIRSYYNYPWNCVLRYHDTTTGRQNTTTAQQNTATTKGNKATVPRIDLEIHCLNRGRSGKKVGGGEICMADDAVVGLSIGASCGWIEYRVHVIGKGWYSRIHKCDWATPDAYAGDLKRVIDAVQIYFHTDTKLTGGKYYAARYQVKTQKHGWLPAVEDTNWESGDGDHTAGIFGDPVIGILVEAVPC